jgi:ABC-type branched-subunit amino acid transport system substrate-binding protein
LSPYYVTKSTASYTAWWNSKPALSGPWPTPEQVAGNMYETVMLYSHALTKVKADGGNYTDGTALMAALKTVAFPGVTHEEVKLDALGEIASPYQLFNYQSGPGKWISIGNWTDQAASGRRAGTFRLVADYSKYRSFSGTSVLYPDSAVVKVGVLVNRIGDQFEKIVRKAVDFIGQNGYVKGYSIQAKYQHVEEASNPMIPESWASNDVGLAASSMSLLNADHVVAILGPKSSVQVGAIQPTAKTRKRPLISFGASRALLTDRPYFMRTYRSDTDQMDLMLQAVNAINLKTGVVSLVHGSYREDSASFRKRAALFGVTVTAEQSIVATSWGNDVSAAMTQLHTALARFVLLSATQNATSLLLAKACSSPLMGAGVGWWVMRHPAHVNLNVCANTVGWLHAQVSWDFSSPTSISFANAFHNMTGQLVTDATQGDLVESSVAAWNSVLLIAKAIGVLYKKNVYNNNVDFYPSLITEVCMRIDISIPACLLRYIME